jgi:plasmid maintenance system antidote protein VapI
MRSHERRMALRLWESGMTHRELAAMYRVNRKTVRNIVSQELTNEIRYWLARAPLDKTGRASHARG